MKLKPVIPLALLLLGCLGWAILRSPRDTAAPATAAEEKAPEQPATSYTQGPATPDGIGKFFHGREIAKVMGHPAIGWLERDEREQEEAPSKAIAAMELPPAAVVADIGAGSGFHTFLIAPKVPLGKVYAVDIQPEMLDFVREKAERLGVANVVPHLGAIDDLKLPPASVDAALLVDAYHEFSHPAEMLASLAESLKPGGRVYLLEFRGEDPRVPIKELHKMTETQARLELESAGLKFVSNRRHLPWQHFMVFEKP